MQESQSQPVYIVDDEITLKELILKFQEFFQEIWKYWKLVIYISFPLIVLMLYQTYTKPSTYKAELTFMVNQDEGSGGISGLTSILGQFGLGSSGGGKYNLDRILELSTTQNIIHQALFEKRMIEGRYDFLANQIIITYDFHDNWKNNEDYPELAEFLFQNDSFPLFNVIEKIALKSVYRKIVGSQEVEGIFSRSSSEESGIMNMVVNSENEELSIELVKAIYEKLSTFYVNKTTERNATTYRVIKSKSDSILNLLIEAEVRLARFKDKNRGLFLREAQLDEYRLERQVRQYGIMYGEAVKNVETSDFVLKNQTPFVQLIDEPYSPISPQRGSLVMALITGGFLGGFLAVGFIIFRKIIRDTMSEEAS